MHLITIGGSDAGISTALRARELDPETDVTVVVADAFPNFSICGIPYLISGEVGDWRHLAHRTRAELEATGMQLRLDTVACSIDAAARTVRVARDGKEEVLSYDALVVGTGAVPVRPRVDGLSGEGALGPADGVHLLHSMGDTFALMTSLERRPARAVIVGAGYIGLEMAEGLTLRGIAVTEIEQLPEVLPTLDPELGALVRAELEAHGVEVLCRTAVTAVRRSEGRDHALEVEAQTEDGDIVRRPADVVLVVVGVRPDTELATGAGAATGPRGALAVDREMRTNLPGVFAAGDCAVTYHRLLGDRYLPLGTTAHKQGRVAGENALGGHRRFAGSLGTQVVKVFELVIARTGLRGDEAIAAGFAPATVTSQADDHKSYYPGSQTITMRFTGEQTTGRLLGLQLVGRLGSEIAKRVDIAAAALFSELAVDDLSDLDLSYTPPLGSPWDALQAGAQAWRREEGAARHG